MTWLCATLVVDAVLAETLSEALMEAGASSVDLADAGAGKAWETPIFDEPDPALPAGGRGGGALSPALAAGGWRRAQVAALFDTGADVHAAVAAALKHAGAERTTDYEISRLQDDDWVRRTQSQFTPQHVTQRLWIVPSWHAPPDPGALNIVLDPGLAFGTGTHPTTRLCLRWLESRIRGGETVVDFGCGSGILAIAALKLGAAQACGVDIDPQAVAAARSNAERNAVAARFVSGTDPVGGPGHVVVANILAQPLLLLAPMIAELTLKGGQLALSGILSAQAEDVRRTYRAWYDFESAQDEDGWVLLSGMRR